MTPDDMDDLLKRSLDHLERLQWFDDGYWGIYCPVCEGSKPDHKPDCEVASLLDELRWIAD